MTKATLDIKEVHSAIDSSVATTLEGMLFLEALPVEGPSERECDVWGRLEAASPVPCRITFQAEKALAGRLAGELHLCDDAPTDAIMRDTVAELVNTIAGAALGALDEELEIVMGLPDTGIGKVQFLQDVVQRRYQIDDEQVLVSIELKSEVTLTSS